tara:strand:+ start:5698 stop:6501 length:804 start_codon:yes stop_codon:yes gene_type:complete
MTAVKPKSPISFKFLRILILLIILGSIAGYMLYQKYDATDWRDPLTVAIYPIAGDAAPGTQDYINTLSAKAFQPVEGFLTYQASLYGVNTHPLVQIKLGPQIHDYPPQIDIMNASVWQRIWWSLKLRYWVLTHSPTKQTGRTNVKMYIIYHQPAPNSMLKESFGIETGLIGMVNAFASPEYQGMNNVVLTHELLHTLGATDKYNMETLAPIYPDGYADPMSNPRYPQNRCEIMAGRVPVTAHEALTPNSIYDCMVGAKTAKEINWRK